MSRLTWSARASLSTKGTATTSTCGRAARRPDMVRTTCSAPRTCPIPPTGTSRRLPDPPPSDRAPRRSPPRTTSSARRGRPGRSIGARCRSVADVIGSHLLEREDGRDELLRPRRRLACTEVDVHVDELARRQRLLPAEDTEAEPERRSPDASRPAADVEDVVVACRGVELGAGLHREDVGAELLHDGVRVVEPDGAPIFGNRHVEVQKIVGIEDHALPVDFGPAHPQRVEQGELVPFHRAGAYGASARLAKARPVPRSPSRLVCAIRRNAHIVPARGKTRRPRQEAAGWPDASGAFSSRTCSRRSTAAVTP